jgi:hypothetical protein
MSSRDDYMLWPADETLLSLSRGAPEEKDHRLRLVVDGLDDAVRELLPALTAVGVRLTRSHGEDGVEEQDALVCPAF